MESQNIDIIEATESEIPAIGSFFLEMWKQSGPDAPGFTGATEEVIAEIARPDAILARIAGPERRMFLARSGGAVVGFAATRFIDDAQIELAGVIVLQTMIGRGVGTPLVEAAVESARSHGHKLMRVSTETGNTRALQFYQSRGFEICGESSENVEGTTVPVVELERPL
jgi:ribosomal protein S18 acetylase RimI-like enzyme